MTLAPGCTHSNNSEVVTRLTKIKITSGIPEQKSYFQKTKSAFKKQLGPSDFISVLVRRKDSRLAFSASA